MKEVMLKEYLVTVYDVVSLARKGAYTLYGESYDVVSEKAYMRKNVNEVVTLAYKGESLLTDWSDEY